MINSLPAPDQPISRKAESAWKMTADFPASASRLHRPEVGQIACKAQEGEAAAIGRPPHVKAVGGQLQLLSRRGDRLGEDQRIVELGPDHTRFPSRLESHDRAVG